MSKNDLLNGSAISLVTPGSFEPPANRIDWDATDDFRAQLASHPMVQERIAKATTTPK